MNEMIGKILPILLLMALGVIIRRKNIISPQGVQGIRYMVVNVGLSSVLFLMFMEIQLDVSYIYVFLVAFVLLALMMFAGCFFNLIPSFKHRYNMFISSCCAFSLVGLALFTIIYGEENIAIFSVIGLAHEIFVWVVFYSLLRVKIGGKKFSSSELIKVLTTPTLLCIAAGLLINVLGINTMLADYHIWQGFINAVDMVSKIATPLILILLGYGLTINKDYLKQSVKLMVVRYAVTFAVGVPIVLLVVNYILPPSPFMMISFISLLLIPPMFSLPLLIGNIGDDEGEEIVSNAIAIGTVVGVTLFVLYGFFAV